MTWIRAAFGLERVSISHLGVELAILTRYTPVGCWMLVDSCTLLGCKWVVGCGYC
jgi:hypothetical protein